jgi:cytoplasmic iron level regulating protein YaaA (DUF328/UPF0246 family)
MLLLLSPAKSLDYQTRVPAAVLRRASEPLFVDRAEELIQVLAQRSAGEIRLLMSLSQDLADLNVARYAAWQPQATAANSKPAVLAFDGDVYGGLDARSLRAADLDWAQEHIAILSGLYGVLRPLDRLQPYRLEMGTSLATARGRNLYDYWGDSLAQHLNERLQGQRRPVVVNLASQEYARAALRPALKAQVIDCQFEDLGSDGSFKIISFFAKRARGLMARFAIEHRTRRPQALQAFAQEGYRFAPEVSSGERWVFRRTIAP